MRVDEYRKLAAAGMSEKQLQEQIIALAKRLGWMVYHTYDSRRSVSGYPDLHLVHDRQHRAMLRELKSASGVVTVAQRNWLAALHACGVDVGVWRPEHLLSGQIEKELRGVG